MHLWEGLDGLGRLVTVRKGLGGFDKVRKGSGRFGRVWVGPRRAIVFPLG